MSREIRTYDYVNRQVRMALQSGAASPKRRSTASCQTWAHT
jgi:hypothetical protein